MSRAKNRGTKKTSFVIQHLSTGSPVTFVRGLAKLDFWTLQFQQIVSYCFGTFQFVSRCFMDSSRDKTEPGRGGAELAGHALQDLLASAQAGSGVLESLVDELDDAVFVVDRDQKVLFFNRAAEALTGFAREKVVGQHCLKAIRCERCLKSCGVFERKRVRDVPLELFRSDGTSQPIVKSASVLTDEEGDVIGAVEVFRARQAEDGDEPAGIAKLLEGDPSTWTGLEALLASLGRGFLILDSDFTIHHASTGIAELLGHTPRSLRGRSASHALGDELFGADSPFRAALESGERREGWRAVVADGAG